MALSIQQRRVVWTIITVRFSIIIPHSGLSYIFRLKYDSIPTAQHIALHCIALRSFISRNWTFSDKIVDWLPQVDQRVVNDEYLSLITLSVFCVGCFCAFTLNFSFAHTSTHALCSRSFVFVSESFVLIIHFEHSTVPSYRIYIRFGYAQVHTKWWKIQENLYQNPFLTVKHFPIIPTIYKLDNSLHSIELRQPEFLCRSECFGWVASTICRSMEHILKLCHIYGNIANTLHWCFKYKFWFCT